MKLSKRANTVILWLIAIGLVLGMIIMFTPNLGIGGGAITGPTALRVNGEAISEQRVNQARANPIYYSVTEGEVGADLELLLIDSIVRQELLRQAASSTRVTNAQVNQAVSDFRTERGVAGRGNDSDYLTLIGSAGFDDASFRNNMREQLRQQIWEENVVGDIDVTDEEVRTFFEAFRDSYRTEERIVGRVIAVNDIELANELRARVLTGESFAALATEHSQERGDRAGALGAAAGSTTPVPVGRAALPSAVSNAAFGLRQEGLTNVVSAAGMYYLVSVEEFLAPERRDFEEVASAVRDDALQAKRVGIVSAELERLFDQADIVVEPDSGLRFNNYVVATVDDHEIDAVEHARATYGNAEVQQFLDPGLAFLIEQILKPQILEQVIDQRIAYIGASELDGEFFGTPAQVAQEALAYVARDVVVEDEALREYYERNRLAYTLPASAQAVRFEFDTFEEAEAFRENVVAGITPTDAALEAGVDPEDMGTVTPGSSETAIDAALFGTDAFVQIDGSAREISDVLFISAAAEAEEDEAAPDGAEEADPDAADAEVEADAEAEADIEVEAEADVEVDADADAGATADDDAAADEDTAAEADADRDRYVVLVAARTQERVREFEEVVDQVRDVVTGNMRAELQQEWLDGIRETVTVNNLLEVAEPDIDFAPEFDFSPEPADTTDDADPVGGDAAADETAVDDDAAAEDAAADEDTAAEADADAQEDDAPEAQGDDGQDTEQDEPEAPAGSDTE